jgi:hypothetical protein
MRKTIGAGVMALLLGLASGCEREESAELPGAEQPGSPQSGIQAPYVIEPLDGRVTVDTQRFDVPVREDTLATEVAEHE